METNGMQNLRILEIKGLDFRLFLLFTSAQPSAPILTLPHARFRSLSQWRKMPNLPIILHAAFLLFFYSESVALCVLSGCFRVRKVEFDLAFHAVICNFAEVKCYFTEV